MPPVEPEDDTLVPDPTDPGAAAQDAAELEWAGDLYEQGDESDPAEAWAVFSGAAGEQAWLDRASDGVLTGWVRDAGGDVYRYIDADAWAIDVDQSGMKPAQGAADDESTADDEAAGTAPEAGAAAVEDEAAPDDVPNEPTPEAETDVGPEVGPLLNGSTPPPDLENPVDEDDDEDEKRRPRFEGKFLSPSGRGYLSVRPR